MSEPFYPTNVINIPFTATSSTFTLVNNTSVTQTYAFSASTICHIKRGFSDIGAATTSDFRLGTAIVLFRLAKNEGVRVIRNAADGVLQIGDISS